MPIGENGRDKRVPPASRETRICAIGVNGRDKRVPPASRETGICAIGENGRDKRAHPPPAKRGSLPLERTDATSASLPFHAHINFGLHN